MNREIITLLTQRPGLTVWEIGAALGEVAHEVHGACEALRTALFLSRERLSDHRDHYYYSTGAAA